MPPPAAALIFLVLSSWRMLEVHPPHKGARFPADRRGAGWRLPAPPPVELLPAPPRVEQQMHLQMHLQMHAAMQPLALLAFRVIGNIERSPPKCGMLPAPANTHRPPSSAEPPGINDHRSADSTRSGGSNPWFILALSAVWVVYPGSLLLLLLRPASGQRDRGKRPRRAISRRVRRIIQRCSFKIAQRCRRSRAVDAGGECSGTVTRVKGDPSDAVFKVGDEVCGAISGCLKTYVTTRADQPLSSCRVSRHVSGGVDDVKKAISDSSCTAPTTPNNNVPNEAPLQHVAKSSGDAGSPTSDSWHTRVCFRAFLKHRAQPSASALSNYLAACDEELSHLLSGVGMTYETFSKTVMIRAFALYESSSLDAPDEKGLYQQALATELCILLDEYYAMSD
ncbi:unnamed protein product [Vitrella brassicaformis CCMP3155]|uniref:4a-hydroxytetrahydrobiopterin dehydratase n=3 Tax=Vitrella brassicaformis TaxID=1169539 RepID=A0A0G4EZ05_VITBC|nr:unnamed protein product [Vitrella brassicaformis CCMP3155]|eukprot:CEM04329.1 unnamed protein product [Vitrella brassicaformis CCMP3155]